MTTEQKVIKTKMRVLELARQLGNVSQACKVMAAGARCVWVRHDFATTKPRLEAGLIRQGRRAARGSNSECQIAC